MTNICSVKKRSPRFYNAFFPKYISNCDTIFLFLGYFKQLKLQIENFRYFTSKIVNKIFRYNENRARNNNLNGEGG